MTLRMQGHAILILQMSEHITFGD